MQSGNNMIRVENMSKNEPEAATGRRDFLKGLLGAGAFVLGVSLMPDQILAATTAGESGDPFPPSEKAPLQPGVYLAIGTDGTAYVVAHRSEMGVLLGIFGLRWCDALYSLIFMLVFTNYSY